MKTSQLLPEHLDALRAIGREASAAAGANLARLTGMRVDVGVSSAHVASIIDVARIVGELPARTSVACMRVHGDVSGDLLLVLPATVERALLQALDVNPRDREMRSSALRELANIVLGGWLVAVEREFGLVGVPAPPMLGDGDPAALLEPSIARTASDDDAVPSLDATLTLEGEGLPRGAMHVLFLPAPGALHRILRVPQRATRHDQGSASRVEHPVHMGELVISTRPGDVLVARGLGSCVALALIEERARIAAVAHVMLPAAPRRMQLGGRPTWPARYADRAVRAAVDAIVAAGGRPSNIKAYIAGGSQMFEGVIDADQLQTGARNVDGVRKALRDVGLVPAAADTGGATGRVVEVDVASLEVSCRVPLEGRLEYLRRAA